MNTASLTRVAKARRMAVDGTARQIRIDARLSIREVADAVGVEVSTVHRWETGERPHIRAELAERYGALLEELGAAS